MFNNALRLVTQRNREADGTTVILFECGHTQHYATPPPEDEIESECARCAADLLAARQTGPVGQSALFSVDADTKKREEYPD